MTKQDIINRIRAVLRRHPYVVRAELFGSLAHGEAGPESDVDLILMFDESKPKGFKSLGIYTELEAVLDGRKVDIVQDKLLHGFVKDNIQEDRELIYEKNSATQGET